MLLIFRDAAIPMPPCYAIILADALMISLFAIRLRATLAARTLRRHFRHAAFDADIAIGNTSSS